MKRLIGLLFAIIIVLTLLAGCDGIRDGAAPLSSPSVADMDTETEMKQTITADEARTILQTWADGHPFQLDSELDPGNDEYTVDGAEYYRFYLDIIRLGVAEMLVDKETGEIFHLTSPYDGDVGFEPADDWYNREHASDDTSAAEIAAQQRALWLGSWYGYWEITDANDTYITHWGSEVDTWDCYAVIKIDGDGSGVIYLWDDNMEIGTIEISHEQNMNEDAGVVKSAGGELFEYPIQNAGLPMTPGLSNDERGRMLVIDGSFEYPDGGWIAYEICLRPWGALWDDVPADKRPPYYDGWYVEAGGKDMPEALTEAGIRVHSGVH